MLTKVVKNIKKILPIILGIIVGYILTLYVFSELIPILIGSQGIVYLMVLYSTLAFSMLFFMLVFQALLTKKISKVILYLWMFPYFIIFVCVLFCRHSYESFFVMNPAVGLVGMVSDWEMLLQCLLNALIFIPIGYFFRKRGTRTTLVLSSVLALLIETIQYVFKLGFFDTFDCLLYILGICLGKNVFQKISSRYMNN